MNNNDNDDNHNDDDVDQPKSKNKQHTHTLPASDVSSGTHAACRIAWGSKMGRADTAATRGSCGWDGMGWDGMRGEKGEKSDQSHDTVGRGDPHARARCSDGAGDDGSDVRLGSS